MDDRGETLHLPGSVTPGQTIHVGKRGVMAAGEMRTLNHPEIQAPRPCRSSGQHREMWESGCADWKLMCLRVGLGAGRCGEINTSKALPAQPQDRRLSFHQTPPIRIWVGSQGLSGRPLAFVMAGLAGINCRPPIEGNRGLGTVASVVSWSGVACYSTFLTAGSETLAVKTFPKPLRWTQGLWWGTLLINSRFVLFTKNWCLGTQNYMKNPAVNFEILVFRVHVYPISGK